jgi:hypothetical protein
MQTIVAHPMRSAWRGKSFFSEMQLKAFPDEFIMIDGEIVRLQPSQAELAAMRSAGGVGLQTPFQSEGTRTPA